MRRRKSSCSFALSSLSLSSAVAPVALFIVLSVQYLGDLFLNERQLAFDFWKFERVLCLRQLIQENIDFLNPLRARKRTKASQQVECVATRSAVHVGPRRIIGPDDELADHSFVIILVAVRLELPEKTNGGGDAERSL